jgi:hypothetical protein
MIAGSQHTIRELKKMADRFDASTFAGSWARRRIKELEAACSRPTTPDLDPV